MTKLFATALALLAATASAQAPVAPSKHRAAAEEVARFLRSSTESAHDLGSGVAGHLLFFNELHAATGDPALLADVRRLADRLLASLPERLNPEAPGLPAAGFMHGVGGIAFALETAHAATGEARYRAGALRAVELVHGAARPEGRGVSWSAFNDLLFGDAGTTLFLLWAADRLDHQPSRELAVRAGHALLDRARSEKGGLNWTFRRGAPMVLPNFSHGAAGVGYVLAALHAATGRAEFREGALGAARYLEAVARTQGDTFLVPYGWPDPAWAGVHEIGWAHGAAGTGRFLYRLFQMTGDAAWLERTRGAARGIAESPRPGDPGHETRIDMRFGTAGAAQFLLGLHRATREPEWLAAADLLIDDLLAKSTVSANGRSWTFPRYAFMERPGEPEAFTGYLHGAAGFGLLLLERDAVGALDLRGARLPDNPFHSDLFVPPAPRTVTFPGDGLEITADVYDGPGRHGPVVLLLHQSGSSRSEYRQIAPRLVRLGWNAVAVDLRWGHRDRWNNVANATAARNGTRAVMQANDPSRVWPVIAAAAKDVDAAIRWTKGQGYDGPLVLWGSSFSAMLAVDMGRRADVAGVVAFSPGEYDEREPERVRGHAKQVQKPALVVAGAGELDLARPVYDALPHAAKRWHQSTRGRHASSILLQDPQAWPAVEEFLAGFAPRPITRFLAQPSVDATMRLPLIEGGRVMFLAEGSVPPRVLGDFNDWGDASASGHGHGDTMPVSGLPGWFSYETEVTEDARVEYAIEHGGKSAPDPHNPETVDAFGTPVSVVRMPRHVWPPELDTGIDVPRGRIDTLEIGGHKVQVYLPAKAGGERLPGVYLQDGSLYVDAGVPRILDALIACGRIPPVLAVFVDPAPRRVDYNRHPPFRRFYAEELVPAIDARFPTDPRREARTIVGSSRGALASLDLALAHPGVFGNVGLFAPALRPSMILDELPAADGRRWAIVTGRYDLAWREDGKLLHEGLVARGHAVSFREHPEGHSLHVWRARLGELLAALLVPPRVTSATDGHP
jgi:enterochelin esterase-like enzyme/dienelactone hydrolase